MPILHPPTDLKLDPVSLQWYSPNDIIEAMIDLRIQLFHLKQQIEALETDFAAACLSLNLDKIALERAVITRRLTPGQWSYALPILQQEELLKDLKQAFQQEHEPTGGREVTWAIKLLWSTPSHTSAS